MDNSGRAMKMLAGSIHHLDQSDRSVSKGKNFMGAEGGVLTQWEHDLLHMVFDELFTCTCF